MLRLSTGDELNNLPMPTVEVEVYHEWWEFDTDAFPPLSLLTFPHHGGIFSWWEYHCVIIISCHHDTLFQIFTQMARVTTSSIHWMLKGQPRNLRWTDTNRSQYCFCWRICKRLYKETRRCQEVMSAICWICCLIESEGDQLRLIERTIQVMLGPG